MTIVTEKKVEDDASESSSGENVDIEGKRNKSTRFIRSEIPLIRSLWNNIIYCDRYLFLHKQ